MSEIARGGRHGWAGAVSMRQPGPSRAGEGWSSLLDVAAVVSETLAGAPELRPALEQVARLLGEAADVALAEVLRFDAGSAAGHALAQWTRPGTEVAGRGGMRTWSPGAAAELWRSLGAGTAYQASRAARSAEDADAGTRAVLVVPVFLDGRLWGALGLDDGDAARQWSHEELALLRTAAAAVSAAARREGLERARREAVTGVQARAVEERTVAIARHERLVTTAIAASRTLLSTADPARARRDVFALLAGALDLDRVALGRLQPAGDGGAPWCELIDEWTAPGVPRQMDDPRLVRTRLAGGVALLERFVRGEPVQGTLDELPPEARAEQAAAGVKAGVAVPLLVGGEAWGVLAGDDCRRARRWDEGELAVLQMVGDALAAAEQRGRVEARQWEAVARERERAAEERAAELGRSNAALQATLGRLAERQDLGEFLGTVLLSAAAQLGAISVALFAHHADRESCELMAFVADGERWDPRSDERLGIWCEPVALAKSPTARAVLDAGEPLLLPVLPEGDGGGGWPRSLAFHRRMGHRTVLTVPLTLSGRLVGFLAAGLRDERTSLPPELETVRALGYQAVLALELTRLGDAAREAAVSAAVARERERAADERAAALAAEVARRAHAERVAAGQAAVLTRAVERLANAGADLGAMPGAVVGVRDALLAAVCEQLGGARVDLWTLDRARDEARLVITVHADGRRVAGRDQLEHPGSRPIPLSAWKGTPGYVAFETGECLRVGAEYDHPSHAPFRAWMEGQGLVSALQTPVRVRGEPVAVFFVLCGEDRPFPPAERELAKAVGHALALAFEAERLADAARAASAQSAVLEERTRIARELHDTVTQGLTGIVMQLGAVREKLADEPAAYRLLHAPLERAAHLARENLAAARRAIALLRPGVVPDEGLGAALARLVDEAARDRAGGAAVEYVSHEATRPAPPEVEFELARIAQAALANAVRHAEARRVVVALDHGASGGGIRITVRDDGRGFDPAASHPGHFGLVGMRERAARVGAALTIVTAPGEGTEVVVMWTGSRDEPTPGTP